MTEVNEGNKERRSPVPSKEQSVPKKLEDQGWDKLEIYPAEGAELEEVESSNPERGALGYYLFFIGLIAMALMLTLWQWVDIFFGRWYG